jgi:glyoxylase-like metal-dependent hydrolase (beta-lactamase superfamily II)
MDKSYKITTMALGPMENFIYLITDIASRKTAVVDPAWEPGKIIEAAEKENLKISGILLTHSHHDHINGVGEILNKYDSELHLLKEEADFWRADLEKPSIHHGGDIISLGETCIEVMHTPGHTPGSACYRLDGDIITGDTLFVFGCGRCDLQGGDPEQMFATLKKMKTHIPSDTIIFPGHNYADKTTSTIEEQAEGNPFLHFEDCEQFVEYRMHTHDKVRSTPYHPVLIKDLLSN